MSESVLIRCETCGFVALGPERIIIELQGWSAVRRDGRAVWGVCPACTANAAATHRGGVPPAEPPDGDER